MYDKFVFLFVVFKIILSYILTSEYLFVHFLGCTDCKDGWMYLGEGEGCVDLNECLDQDVCTSQQFCVNNDGSYSCLSKCKEIINN